MIGVSGKSFGEEKSPLTYPGVHAPVSITIMEGPFSLGHKGSSRFFLLPMDKRVY